MPPVTFPSLPDDARVWVFAASDPIAGDQAAGLLGEVDDYLGKWHAHGESLTCARDWRDGRFLAIGVDQSSAGASGCSIDGLFRVLQRQQASLGTMLVGGGRVFYRDTSGEPRCVDRARFSRLAAQGTITADTPVFDLTVTSAAAYRMSFERPLRESWHQELIGRSPQAR